MPPSKPYKFSDPFAAVETEPILTSEGRETNRQIIKVKDDDGLFQPVSDVSRGYQLITNETALQIVQDVQTRSKFSWSEMKKPEFTGQRFSAYYMSEEPIASIKNGIERTMKVGLLVRNSYNGSCKFGIQLFLAFMECLNQFHSANQFGNFLLRHTSGEEGNNLLDADDAAAQIGRCAGVMIETAPLFKELVESGPLTLGDIRGAKKQITELTSTKWGEVIDNIETDSQWGLLNGLTYVATHRLEGDGSLRVGEAIGRYYLQDSETAKSARSSKSD